MRYKKNKRLPRWFQEQSNKRKNRIKKYLYLFLKLILGALIIVVIYFLYNENKRSLWDGNHNFNLAVYDNVNIYVLSFHKDSQKINILLIPPDTYLPLAKGFGDYPAGSIWALGEMEVYGGGELLRLSAQNFLGAPIQGWGKIENQKSKNENKELNKKSVKWLLFQLFFSRQKNLVSWDLLRLYFLTNSSPNNSLNFYNLSETRAAQKITLPDGSSVFKVQKDFMDNLVKNLFYDETVANESIIAAILNQSDYNGPSGYAARIINNIGGETAAFYDSKRGLKEAIYCWKENVCRSYSLKLYSQVFKLPIIQEDVNESRAEILIVLGNNFGRYFFQR